MAKQEYVDNIGDLVICDFCNADGQDSMGGVIIGSYAVCGTCCEQKGYYDKNYEYAHEISEHFDIKKTFQENVLDYRKRTTGTTDGIVCVSGYDDPKEWIEDFINRSKHNN